MTCSRCARSGAPTCPIGSRRSRASPAMRSATMSAPALLPAAPCAIASIRAHGLSAIEVAKVCFIAGLTFWLGNATVLGLGVADRPQAASAIDQLPPLVNRALGVCDHRRTRGLCGVGVANAARGRPSQLARHPAQRAADAAADRRRHHRSRLLRRRHVHAGAGRALYRLRHAGGDLRRLDAARICEPLAGRARGVRRRHAGGLWQFDTEDLVAGLLLFRLLYYLVPFAISLPSWAAGRSGSAARALRAQAGAAIRGQAS